ncbi:hypothetical protein GCM10022277_37740 [Litoribacillus peritrichatus]|uniref:Uncharacterized protein n=1 Tax=Litoribacillus peritrichatus TaxID=718191 RepID=A0ABP7N834_9GAMM
MKCYVLNSFISCERMRSRTNLYCATVSSYRDSLSKGLYDYGAGWTDLKNATAIKQKRALEIKVRPHSEN